MNKRLFVWKLISRSLAHNISVILLYVLESMGSSPGRQGFFMAINANGEMEGSIGGGIMEHKFVEWAKERLKSEDTRHRGQVKKQIHDKSSSKNQSGMICSGEQTIFLYRMQQEDAAHINNIITCLEQNKNGLLKISPAGINFSDTIAKKDFHFLMQSEEDWSYEEKIGFKNHLFIIGGGHCALAFSKIMSQMDFYIHLFEERKELHTMTQNDAVHVKTVVEDYSKLTDLISSGNNHYVVIMTVGYRSDEIALRALIHKRFRYFGLLGSKSKIEKMFGDLRNEGVGEDIIQKICSPIGLQIKSQTPEEISISIAAEIIKVKNEALPLSPKGELR